MKRYTSLLGFLALVFAISAVGSLVTMPAVEGWYQTIAKPAWTPPDWVFGPVWTTLYILIAIAGWRVWRTLPERFSARFLHPAMRIYWVQLALNHIWSILFFGLASPLLGAVDIVLLLIAIGVNIRVFLPLDKPAGMLLVPYFLWVAYASTLNFGILALN